MAPSRAVKRARSSASLQSTGGKEDPTSEHLLIPSETIYIQNGGVRNTLTDNKPEGEASSAVPQIKDEATMPVPVDIKDEPTMPLPVDIKNEAELA